VQLKMGQEVSETVTTPTEVMETILKCLSRDPDWAAYHACRIGSCGACEVKCRGTIAVSKDCEIDQRTRDAGFVYACCSAALSELEIEA
jgi:ferredoxin